ncbi:hypothetical protein K1T71_010905 [Dendrolimus kikuchii]|uniref:Uncharacterized protein n=1 Tax=Dendrolimus kikuchii TaxID=765133 RepID=A0ACC1CQD2_9NEOP|nr:hypothetical protein K1T71_010905 [Dendrolimus kikuchii]
MTSNFTENLQTYIEVDNCLLTTASLTDKEILDSVKKTEDQEQGDEEDETDEPEHPPKIKEALEAAKLLEKTIIKHTFVLHQILNHCYPELFFYSKSSVILYFTSGL